MVRENEAPFVLSSWVKDTRSGNDRAETDRLPVPLAAGVLLLLQPPNVINSSAAMDTKIRTAVPRCNDRLSLLVRDVLVIIDPPSLMITPAGRLDSAGRSYKTMWFPP